MSGDERQSEEIRPATVYRAYGRGAARFDAYVSAIPGYKTHLRISASRMGLGDGPGLRLLDIGCGTGVSTEALLTTVAGAEVVAVDASAEMLAVARKKNWSPRVTFVHSRLETLAEAGIEGPFDGILASYLVSNLPDAEHGLRRMLSLLAPGAPLAVHDYAVGGTRGRIRWSTATWAYLLPLASMRWGVTDLARYRARRVAAVGGPSVMTHRMEQAGFDDVRVQTVGGMQQHLVHTFLGRRPDEPDVVGQRRDRATALRAASWRPRSVPEPDQQPQDPDASIADEPDEGGPEDPGYADSLPADVSDGAEDTIDGADAAGLGADPVPGPDPAPGDDAGPQDGGGPRRTDDEGDRPRGRGAPQAAGRNGLPGFSPTDPTEDASAGRDTPDDEPPTPPAGVPRS